MNLYGHKEQGAFFGGAAKQLAQAGKKELAEDIGARAAFQAMMANREQVGAYFSMTLGDLVDALHSLPDTAQGYGWRLYSNNRSDVGLPEKTPHLQVVLAFTKLTPAAFRSAVTQDVLGSPKGTPQSMLASDLAMQAVFFGVCSRTASVGTVPANLSLYTFVQTAKVENGILTFVPESDRSMRALSRNWEHEREGQASHAKLGAFVASANPECLGELETRLASGSFGRRDYSFAG